MSFSPPPSLNLSGDSNDSPSDESSECSFHKPNKSLIPRFHTTSDSFKQTNTGTRIGKLVRARSLLSIFQRERRDGAFPTPRKEKKDNKQEFLRAFVPPPDLFGKFAGNFKYNYEKTDDFSEFPEKYARRVKSFEWQEDKTESGCAQEVEEEIFQHPDCTNSMALSDSTETSPQLPNTRENPFRVDNTSPITNFPSPEQNDTMSVPADVDWHQEQITPDSGSANGSSTHPFSQLIRENDHAPAQSTDSPARADEQELCKSLQSEFQDVLRKEAFYYSSDYSKRVLFKETSNEVRFFSRSDSELDLFSKKKRVSVGFSETKYSSSLLNDESAVMKQLPGPSTGESTDLFSLMSQNWKSFEKSAADVTKQVSSWTSTLNMPDVLCTAPQHEPAIRSVPSFEDFAFNATEEIPHFANSLDASESRCSVPHQQSPSRAIPSFEDSVGNVTERISTWTNSLRMPKILCTVPEQQSPIGEKLLKANRTQHAVLLDGRIGDTDQFEPFDSVHQLVRGRQKYGSAKDRSSRYPRQKFPSGELEISESTEIMIREVKGQRFVAFKENENAIPLGYNQSAVPFDRKKTVVNGARRWARTQMTPSPQLFSMELVDDDQMSPLSLDQPYLCAINKTDKQSEVIRVSPIRLLPRPLSTLEDSSLP